MQPPVPGPPMPPGGVWPHAYPGPPYPSYGAPPGPPYPYGAPPGPPRYPYAGGYPPVARPRVGLPRPAVVAPVAGTPFGVALVPIRPTASGPAVSSLVAGIGSVLVSLVVIIFVALGAADGWGPAVAGAFAALATVVGAAAVGLAGAGLRRIRLSVAWGPTRGRGVAVAGLACGALGLLITALAMLVALAG